MSSGAAESRPRYLVSDLERDEYVVQEFLDRLAHALATGDARSVGGMWETPALVVADQGVVVLQSRSEVEGFFGGARAEYNARGIRDTRAEIRAVDWVGQRVAVVEVRWPHLDQNGDEIGEESSIYTLRRDDGGELRVRVAVMRGDAA